MRFKSMTDLWYNGQNACFLGIDDVSNRVDACSVVMPLKKAMLYELVILNVSLHVLPGDNVVFACFVGVTRTSCIYM